MRTSSRYPRMVAISMVAALAVAITAAAQAPSALAQSLKPGQAQPAAGTLPIAGKITVPARAGTPAGTVYGYALCLYRAPHYYCATDDVSGNSTSSSRSAVSPDHAILVDIGEIGGVITVWQAANVAAGHAIKLIARWWWGEDAAPNSSYPIEPDPFDGQCMGDWSTHGDVTEGSCGSAHGIYWQIQSEGTYDFRLWDTYAHGDLIASSLNESPLFCHEPAEDWSTWELLEVVSS